MEKEIELRYAALRILIMLMRDFVSCSKIAASCYQGQNLVTVQLFNCITPILVKCGASIQFKQQRL